jgi:hypothetical protein
MENICSSKLNFLDNNEKEQNKYNKMCDLNKIFAEVKNTFKLPIFYNDLKMELNKKTIKDLELIEITNSSGNSVYECVIDTNNCLGKNIIEMLPTYYTTDTKFLKQTQNYLKNMDTTMYKEVEYQTTYSNMINLWDEIKNDTGFLQKYSYIDFNYFKSLNNNEQFLQCLSIYSILSPLLSFLMPFFILIIPFLYIKMLGKNITFENYKIFLYNILSQHSIGNFLFNFNTADSGQKVYLLISVCMYFLSIYQNVCICTKFYKNMIKIHDYLLKIKEYIKITKYNINTFNVLTEPFGEYNTFRNVVSSKLFILDELQSELNLIQPFEFTFLKFTQIGNILKVFHKIYDDKLYHEAFIYSFGFNGYIDVMNGIKKQLNNDNIHYTTFLSKKNNHIMKFKQMVYPPLINQKPVPLDLIIKNNIILTGVNASGKTTVLKSVIINVIFSQQFGIGCFDELKLCPFKYLHSYLNIIDTSDRLSLFQTECKKCKDILQLIKKDNKHSHLCIFDELFSGTNPDEAVSCGFEFLKYLTNKNVKWLLTTHFNKLCLKLKTTNNIINKKMISNICENKIKHTYKISNGINKLKGGVEILKEMNYPTEILNNL